MLNSKNIPHVMDKKGNIVQKIIISKASLVRVFPENTKIGVLVTKDIKNINCITAAKITLIKIHKKQLFKLEMSQTKCKPILPDRKVIQSTVLMAQKK